MQKMNYAQHVASLKRQKGILKEMVLQKNEMEKKLKESQTQQKRLLLRLEHFESKLKQKEFYLRFLSKEFISSSGTGNLKVKFYCIFMSNLEIIILILFGGFGLF